MTSKRPKYVYVKPNGTDLYFKAPTTGKLPIPALNDPEFNVAYHKLLAAVANGTLSLPVKTKGKGKVRDDGTVVGRHINYAGEASVGALAKAYFASYEFLKLDKRTQTTRRLFIEQCLQTVHPTPVDENGECVPFAERHIDDVAIDICRDLRDAMFFKPDKVHHKLKHGDLAHWRDARMSAMRVLFNWGVDRPYRWTECDANGRKIGVRAMTGNAFRRLRALHVNREGHRVATENECDDLDAYLLAEGLHMDRLAFGLCRYAALRRCDVTRLGAQHVQWITTRQGKVRALVFKEWKGSRSKTDKQTNKQRVIPIRPALWQLIERAKGMERPTFIAVPIHRGGGKYNDNAYGRRFAALCRAAGLAEDFTMHGIRKHCGARMADKGATPHQIASMLGHQDRNGDVSTKNVFVYTRRADQLKLTEDALGFLVDAE